MFPFEYIPRVDETTTADVLYLGYAQPKTATSEAKWAIYKIDTTDGVTITLADGNQNLDNIWDNRASLTYL